jgi:hypothetical protein
MLRGLYLLAIENQNWVWYDFPRRGPDGSWGRPDWQLCNRISKFVEYSFPNRTESGRCCPSIRMVALLLHAIFILKPERSDNGDWRPDGWTSSARLALSRIASGRELYIVRTVAAIFPYLCFGKKSFYLLNTERCPDGCSYLPIFVFWKEIILLVEHWKVSGRVAKTSRQMQPRTVRSF